MKKKIAINTVLNILLAVVLILFIARYFYFRPRFVNGESAPDFSALIMGGEEMQLSDLRGKYVLVDFWGSWCGPCRARNPGLLRLYDKYHQAQFKNADGFEIISVGVERSKKSWQNAIRRDGLKWKYHILDQAGNLKFFDSELTRIFGVKQLPSTYLLNEKGMIIGVNLSHQEIDELLAAKTEV